MKLIHPKKMTEKQQEALRLCLATSAFSFDRDEVLSAIMQNISVIEQNASIIDSGLPIPGLGKIDLIASDGKGNLIVLNFVNELDADKLAKSLMRAEWVSANRMLLEHIHGAKLLSGAVRIVQIAEKILPDAAAILHQINQNAISVYVCEGINLGDEGWIVLKVFEIQTPEQKNDRKEEDKRPFHLHSVLSTEEVEDFFSSADEEITDSGRLSVVGDQFTT